MRLRWLFRIPRCWFHAQQEISECYSIRRLMAKVFPVFGYDACMILKGETKSGMGVGRRPPLKWCQRGLIKAVHRWNRPLLLSYLFVVEVI